MNRVWLDDYFKDPPHARRKGGAGSGNHGHAGRPGQVGGSAPRFDTSEQIEALWDYREYGYSEINAALRGQRSSASAKRSAEALRSAFSNPEVVRITPKNMRVYRAIPDARVARALAKARKGSILRDGALLSTTLKYNVMVDINDAHVSANSGYVEMFIEVPKGMPFLMGKQGTGDGHSEHEHIFAPGTKLRVVSKEVGGTKRNPFVDLYVRMEP